MANPDLLEQLLDQLAHAVSQRLVGSRAPAAKPGRGGGKRHFSPEAIARMREGARRRWAHKRGGSAAPAAAKAAPAKAARKARKGGGMSAEGAARIRAAQKARWAKWRKANAK